MKQVFEGEIEVFCQEGGFACDGIRVDGKDLGELIRGEEHASAEGISLGNAKITVTYESITPDDTPGFFKQIG